MEAVRSAASWMSTDTAPYAFVLGSAKKRSATSRCTMTVQRSTLGSPSRLSTTIGVATLYGEVGDELPRCRFEGREVEAQRVAEAKLDVVSLREPLGQVRLEAAVELDRMHEPDALGEVAGEDTEAGADLEHDVVFLELRESADHAEDVFVDQEVLPQLAVRRDRQLHGSEKTEAAFAEIRSETACVLAADLGQLGDGQNDVRRLVRSPAASLWREVGLSVSARMRSRDLRRCRPQVACLGVGDVAGEGDVVAALDHGRGAPARRSNA